MAIIHRSPNVNFGNGDIVQGETIESFDPYKGYLVETSYEGDPVACGVQMQFLANDFWQCKLTLRTAPSGINYASLNVQKAFDTILPQPVWSINGVKGERNILECKELSFVSGLTSEIKAGIEARIKNPTSKKPLSSTAISDAQSVNAEILLTLMQDGIESKASTNVEVKRNQIYPNRYTPTWNLQYVDTVISLNSLITAFAVPNYLQPILPPSDQILYDQDGMSTIAGYLVGGVDYETIDNGKRVSVTQTFTWGVWSVLPYGIYTYSG